MVLASLLFILATNGSSEPPPTSFAIPLILNTKAMDVAAPYFWLLFSLHKLETHEEYRKTNTHTRLIIDLNRVCGGLLEHMDVGQWKSCVEHLRQCTVSMSPAIYSLSA
jgi:hypothetical protein